MPPVTVPPWRKAGAFAASSAAVMPPLIPSSCLTSPREVVTGTVSASNRPASRAAAARWWLRNAHSSWRSRVMPYLTATFSAVSPS
ncbi:MAG TPA: hypothetical protein VF951_09780, partial [Streptosporangiaceae bacterium]